MDWDFVSSASGVNLPESAPMVQAASYPPLQETQGRGTHSMGGVSEIKSLGDPAPLKSVREVLLG